MKAAGLKNFKLTRSIRLKKQHERTAQEISKEFGLSLVAARILAARDFRNDATLKDFINPSLREGLPDPKLLKNLDAACDLVRDIAQAGGSIAICCDFDVDGLSGASQLKALFDLAKIETEVFVPDRFLDGYGLNPRMVQEVRDKGHKLLIAVDYGTRNYDEIELARQLGLKTIILDHHHVGSEHALADVFVNPEQNGCGFADKVLCAAGLSWYFTLGLSRKLEGLAGLDVRSFLDLACLGTICDMVPLIGANRVIAKRGLELLGQTKRPGLIALKNVAGINSKVSCSNVSFALGPRLNAAGRMVHGKTVVELLTTADSDRAGKLARELNRLNLERQDTEIAVKEQALAMLSDMQELPYGIVVWDPNFHTGVVGIVAQRLVEQFYRPSVVLGQENPEILKGSVRGIKGFSVVEALADCRAFLERYGGHEGAGGLTLKASQINQFKEAFEDVCKKRLSKLDLTSAIEADTEIALAEATPALVNELQSFAPFGVGNPGPVLMIKNLHVRDVKILKNMHLKVTLSDGDRTISAFLWRETSHPALITGAKVNIACRLDLSTFNGLSEVQANLQSAQPS